MQRRSDQDSDGTVWAPVSLRVGASGLDLRRPGDPQSLTECLNARFLDERTVTRRDGHTSQEVRDAQGYASGSHTDEWVYSHGNLVEDGGRTHIPRHRRGGVTFNLGGANVVWTGDRILTLRTDGHPGLGASDFWNKDQAGDPLPRGIPAFLPSMVDTVVQFGVDHELVGFSSTASVETALTPTHRVTGQVAAGSVVLHTYDRTSGAEIDRTDLGLAGCSRIRLVNSDGVACALYLDGSDLWITNWNGSYWTTPTLVDDGVLCYELAPVADGFHLIWVEDDANEVTVGRYYGAISSDEPYEFGTILTGYTGTALLVAIGQAPGGEMGVAVTTSSGVYVRALDEDLTTLAGAGWETTAVTDTRSVCVQPRGLANDDGRYRWVVHYSREGCADGIGITTYFHDASGSELYATVVRRNCVLASRSFRVGDEVFAWMHSVETHTLFLLAGHVAPVVAGYADRETALHRGTVTAGDEGAVILPMVNPDPLDEYAFTWVRPYLTGVDHAHPGNARVGDLQFLPTPSVAHFGRSVYLSGSAVKNWDGHTLHEAGFQEYPILDSLTENTNAGGSVDTGLRGVLVRAVRYNALGERFESAAVTNAITVADDDPTISVVINTLPGCGDGVMLEVYMTVETGDTYYYVGAVANDPTVATVTYTIDISDADLDDRRADPHFSGVDGEQVTEGFGPIGCTLLASAGDRLWGAGGQVPQGQVQFSLLWAANQGAGFDALAGYQVVDPEGHDTTSIAGFGDALVLFQRDRVYVVTGSGPNNYGAGEFGVPQLALADGALNHVGTATIQDGVLYWGTGGPRLLAANLQSLPICDPVLPLSSTLTPTAVRVNISRREVVWYTDSGDALLWNYAGQSPRWARWTGLRIASGSDEALLTTNGVLLIEDPDAVGDGGQPYEFAFACGNLALDELLQGGTRARRAGLTGEYLGEHDVRFRVYHDGSPLWSEQFIWHPDEETWLVTAESVAALTPAEVDALVNVDHSGRYSTHRRLERQTCTYFRIHVSDRGSDRPTFIPYALTFEIGAKPGLGRTPVNTFGA
jgi:hypothetical protein